MGGILKAPGRIGCDPPRQHRPGRLCAVLGSEAPAPALGDTSVEWDSAGQVEEPVGVEAWSLRLSWKQFGLQSVRQSLARVCASGRQIRCPEIVCGTLA